MPVTGVFETLDDPRAAYPAAKLMFEEHPEVRSLYIATDNGEGICRRIVEEGRAGTTAIVATNSFPEMRERIRAGVVQFSLHQNMKLQGRRAVDALYRYLAEGTAPETHILVPPTVVTANALDLFAS